MIKISKLETEKFNYIFYDPKISYVLNTTKEWDRSSLNFLSHDAFKISIINSGDINTVMIDNKIEKMNNEVLLKKLIKVYPNRLLSKYRYSETNVVDFLRVEYTKSFADNDPDNKKYTVLFHKDTEKILNTICNGQEKEAIKDTIAKTLEIYDRYKARDGKSYESTQNRFMWKLYKLLNTTSSIGIQLVMHTEELYPIASLLLGDYLCEDSFNNFNTIKELNNRVRLLNALGEFTSDSADFSKVSSIIQNSLSSMGLLGYIAYNLLEDKYFKNTTNISPFISITQAAYKRRASVLQKLQEFITFFEINNKTFAESFVEGQGVGNILSASFKGCPEQVFEINPTEIKIIKKDGENVLEGLNPNYDNMSVILFRDAMYELENLENAIEEYKVKEFDDKIDKIKEKERLKAKLKDIIHLVEDAKLKLRGHNNINTDLNTIEDRVFVINTNLENEDKEEIAGLGESFGFSESGFLKMPRFLKKMILDLKFMVKDFENTNVFYMRFANFMDNLLSAIPGINIAYGVAVQAPKAIHEYNKNHKFAKNQLKEAKEARRQEFYEQNGLMESAILNGYNIDDVLTLEPIGEHYDIINLSELEGYGEALLPIGISIFILSTIIGIIAPICKKMREEKVAREALKKINNKLDAILMKEGLDPKVIEKVAKLKDMVSIKKEIDKNDSGK